MIEALQKNIVPALIMLGIAICIVGYLIVCLHQRLGLSGWQRYESTPLKMFVAVILWLGIATGFALVIGSLNVPVYYHLARNAQTADGSIIATDPSNHCAARYEFNFKDQTYTGSDPRCGVNVGDHVTVYYNPGNPKDSSTYEPNGALLNELIPIGLVCLIAPTLIVYQFFLFGIFGRRKVDLPKLPYE